MGDTDDIDDIDEVDIYELMAPKVNYLYHQLGSREARVNAISGLPQLTLDFYLVADVVSLTCEEGLGGWIDHHHDEQGWIDCAVEAFTRIGYPQVADGIKSCRAVYLEKGGTMDYGDDDEIPSRYITNHADEIMQALHSYLVAHDFSFRRDRA